MLVELAASGRSDTDKSEAYLRAYDAFLAPLRERNVRLLELGVLHGGSLLLWRDAFPRGVIAGLDREPVAVDDPSGRIVTFQGEQDDVVLLDRIAAQVAPGGFDVVIDDASHIAAPTRTSFWHLFERHLKPGGVYVIEDVDECGIADATHPMHGIPPQRMSRIARMQIAFGQMFVVKAGERGEGAA
jgi:predicted O-methyltransferase YrrM